MGGMGNTGCRRPLNTKILAEDFARYILKRAEDYEVPASRIVKAEMDLKALEGHPTSTHEDYRASRYRSSDQRRLLRDRILGELIDKERLEDDDQISLGNGGAKPKELKSDRVAYIVSGAPASGKSSIAARLADENGAYILDSDYAKRKFPEYTEYAGGASLVHEESDAVVFASEDSLFECCVYNNYNVVIPLVGRTDKSFKRICRRLMECGYEIHIVNVALDRYKCVERAYERFERTERYVPLSYIFDEVGNSPELVYFRIKRDYGDNNSISSFSQISTDVAMGAAPKILEATKNSPLGKW